MPLNGLVYSQGYATFIEDLACLAILSSYCAMLLAQIGVHYLLVIQVFAQMSLLFFYYYFYFFNLKIFNSYMCSQT